MPQPASPAAGTSSAVPSSGQRPEDDDLKPYVITQEIGKGSFATVYKGYHQVNSHFVPTLYHLLNDASLPDYP